MPDGVVKYCHCGAKFTFENARKVIAPATWQAREAWKCGTCNLLHHAVQEPVVVVCGPINANALLHATGKLNGQHILTWAVGNTQVDTVEFFPWPRRHPLSDTEPLIHQTWELLMSKVNVIMADPQPGPVEWGAAKQQARGIAEVLAIQMKPFMESADHVVRCAVKKFKDPEFEVPGLGAHLWNSMMNPDGTPRTPLSAPRPARAKPVARPKPVRDKPVNTSTKRLSPEEAAGIKEAVGSGMFSKEDVAGMFKVSLTTVEEAIAG